MKYQEANEFLVSFEISQSITEQKHTHIPHTDRMCLLLVYIVDSLPVMGK